MLSVSFLAAARLLDVLPDSLVAPNDSTDGRSRRP
jgi:hypothetical protein